MHARTSSRRPWRARMAAGLVLASAALSSCRSGSPPALATATGSPSNAVPFVTTLRPISIDLPTGWQRVDPTPADFAARAAEIAASDPVLGRQMQQVASSGMVDRMRFYAVDLSDGKPLGAANMTAIGPLGSTNLPTLVDSFEVQLGKSGAVGIVRTEATILGRPATVFRYRLDYPGPSGSTATEQEMFVFESEGQVHLATVSCLLSSPSCLSEGDAILRSATTQ